MFYFYSVKFPKPKIKLLLLKKNDSMLVMLDFRINIYLNLDQLTLKNVYVKHKNRIVGQSLIN